MAGRLDCVVINGEADGTQRRRLHMLRSLVMGVSVRDRNRWHRQDDDHCDDSRQRALQGRHLIKVSASRDFIHGPVNPLVSMRAPITRDVSITFATRQV